MFKDKLKYLRKHQELSQAQVAKNINILPSTYSNYEQGIREPDIETIKKLANLFDVSIDYLLENDRSLSDTEEIVDLHNFLLNGRYTLRSRFPTDKDRRFLGNMLNVILDDRFNDK